jgi:hypothetical protein
MDRLHGVQNANTNGRVGYCLDTVDLFLSKAAAAREKDRIFCVALLEHGHVGLHEALAIVPRMPLSDKDGHNNGERSQTKAGGDAEWTAGTPWLGFWGASTTV